MSPEPLRQKEGNSNLTTLNIRVGGLKDNIDVNNSARVVQSVENGVSLQQIFDSSKIEYLL